MVTGEAGSGKTALVNQFSRRALAQYPQLVTAVGLCNATTGVCDAYLPFREILAQLTGDVDAQLLQGAITPENASRLRKLLSLSGEAIAEIGPDLIGIFIPGAGLLARAVAFAADKSGWLDKLSQCLERPVTPQSPGAPVIAQAHIFEQFTNVLRRLAQKQPLLLIVDDLHWADSASCELLFHLARRIQGSPILIVGAYRPEEVSLGRLGERHPLEKVINELKRYFGDILIELDRLPVAESHAFLDALIDSESNLLGSDFRQALLNHTNGQPLFTIELLRDMQERGDLLQDQNGRWYAGPVLNWDDLPTRVEGVIEERIDRLEAGLRQALSIGSVEGETFTAEIVSRLQHADIRALIRSLSTELEKKHRLVTAQGVQSTPTGRISLYRFQHNLFQTYLYHGLDDVERCMLHEDIGNIMEELYTGDKDRVAVQLAHHFDLAGLAHKALPYLRLAGEQAAARYANAEALRYWRRALELTPETDAQTRVRLRLGLEKVYNILGERALQYAELEALRALCGELQDPCLQAEEALREAGYAEAIGDYPVACQWIERCLVHSQAAGDVRLEAQAYLRWGYVLWRQGNYDAALAQLECSLAIARHAGLESVEAGCLAEMGVIYWRKGLNAQAETCYQQALSLYRQLNDIFGQERVLNNLGNIYLKQERYPQAKEYYQDSMQLAQQDGNRRGELNNLGNLGIIAAMEGSFFQARQCFEMIIQIAHELNDPECEGRALGNLGSLVMDLGYYAQAQDYLSKALQIFQSIGNQQAICWILSDRGLAYTHQGQMDAALEDTRCAVTIAEEIGNKHYQCVALNHRAMALIELKQFQEARVDFQRALVIWKELAYPTGIMEALAGLVNICLAEKDLTQALAYTGQILERFDPAQIRDSDGRSYIMLACYHALEATGDPRAAQILRQAYELIVRRAELLDATARSAFLENIACHSQVLALVASGALGDDSR
jgi:tetratricopeptide (TPR) repeat protein